MTFIVEKEREKREEDKSLKERVFSLIEEDNQSISYQERQALNTISDDAYPGFSAYMILFSKSIKSILIKALDKPFSINKTIYFSEYELNFLIEELKNIREAALMTDLDEDNDLQYFLQQYDGGLESRLKRLLESNKDFKNLCDRTSFFGLKNCPFDTLEKSINTVETILSKIEYLFLSGKIQLAKP